MKSSSQTKGGVETSIYVPWSSLFLTIDSRIEESIRIISASRLNPKWTSNQEQFSRLVSQAHGRAYLYIMNHCSFGLYLHSSYHRLVILHIHHTRVYQIAGFLTKFAFACIDQIEEIGLNEIN